MVAVHIKFYSGILAIGGGVAMRQENSCFNQYELDTSLKSFNRHKNEELKAIDNYNRWTGWATKDARKEEEEDEE